MQPQPVHQEQPIALPGFTAEQTASLQAMITAAVKEALDKHFGPLQATQITQQSTPPAPQEALKEQAKELLYQATVEDDTEDGNSMLANKSTLSSFSYLCTAPASRDPTACFSKALLSAHQQASFLTTFLGPLLGYIRYLASMEASGEG